MQRGRVEEEDTWTCIDLYQSVDLRKRITTRFHRHDIVLESISATMESLVLVDERLATSVSDCL